MRGDGASSCAVSVPSRGLLREGGHVGPHDALEQHVGRARVEKTVRRVVPREVSVDAGHVYVGALMGTAGPPVRCDAFDSGPPRDDGGGSDGIR